MDDIEKPKRRRSSNIGYDGNITPIPPRNDYIGKVFDEYEAKINSRWRPMMAWLYMATCAFDFVIAPVLWGIVQALTHQPVTQWHPLTLEGAGLYHLAMGAVIGLTSYSKTKERLNAMNIYATASPNYGFPEPQQPNSPPTDKPPTQ